MRQRSGFLIGPQNLDDDQSANNARRVFLDDSDDELYLVAYRRHSCTVIMLVDYDAYMNMAFYRTVRYYCGSGVTFPC